MERSVSILIPAYDAEAWVGEAIESALGQTWTDREVVVVDDGSRDATRAVLERFGDRIRWESGPHRGAPGARNRLLDLARGRWLQYLDADDLLQPTKVARQLEASEGADLVVSPYLTDRGVARSVADDEDPWLAFLKGCMGVTSSNLFRRDALHKAGGWDVDRCAAQEAELVQRMLCTGARVAFVREPLCIKRRVNPASLWRTAWRRDPEAASAANVSAVTGAVEYLRHTGQLDAARTAAAGARFFVMARAAWRAGADAARVVDAAHALGIDDADLLSDATGIERTAFRAFGVRGVERTATLRADARRRTRRWARAARRGLDRLRSASPRARIVASTTETTTDGVLTRAAPHRGASRLRDGDPYLEELADRQARLLPALTRTGLERRRTPEDLQRLLADWFTRRRGREEPERGAEAVVRSHTGDAPSELLPLERALEERVLAGMQPILEGWCGYSLEPVCAFGIRVYNPGSVLYRHVDRIATHAVSAVLQVAQDVDVRWPLVVEGADGARHEFELEPGDALLYEGARLPHYRDEPLRGRFYASVFVHFRPRWWRFTLEDMEHREAGGRRSLAYGHPPERAQPLPPSDRYLAFEPDYGGWTNILMQFEILAALAWLTGRTLVLPPPARLYLLGDDPHRLEDFLDLDRLRRHLPVLTHAEFAAREKPAPAAGTSEAFHAWMRRHAHAPGWHGLEDVLVDPEDARERRPELAERIAGRRAVGLDEIEKHRLLYFPMTEPQRMFGVAECFFLLADPERERRLRTLLRDAVRYRPEIVDLAERALASRALAVGPFSALHVRRGDFGRQYPETQIPEREILRNVRSLFQPGETLYLATDARDGVLLRLLRDEFHVVAFADLSEDVTSRTPAAWRGMLEMLVCAAAPGRFVGTRLSTFSARIATLRGHLSHTPGGDCAGHDTTLYYTQPPLHGPSRDPDDETLEPWWHAIRTAPIWSRAYHEVWSGAES